MTDDIVTRLREDNGTGCTCSAHCSCECGCSDAIWASDYIEDAAKEIERLRTVLRKANICAGCDQPWQDEAHIHGKTKCCPDCSHEYPKAVCDD